MVDVGEHVVIHVKRVLAPPGPDGAPEPQPEVPMYVQAQLGNLAKRTNNTVAGEWGVEWEEDVVMPVVDQYLVLVVRREDWDFDPQQYVGACKVCLPDMPLGEAVAVQLQDAAGRPTGKLALELFKAVVKDPAPHGPAGQASAPPAATAAPTGTIPHIPSPPAHRDDPQSTAAVDSNDTEHPELVSIFVLDAEEIDCFEPCSPYVLLQAGEVTKRTITCHHTAQPVWDEEFLLAVRPSDVVDFILKDDGAGAGREMGYGTLRGRTLLDRRGAPQFWLVLRDAAERSAGKLRLALDFPPTAATAPAVHPSPPAESGEGSPGRSPAQVPAPGLPAADLSPAHHSPPRPQPPPPPSPPRHSPARHPSPPHHTPGKTSPAQLPRPGSESVERVAITVKLVNAENLRGHRPGLPPDAFAVLHVAGVTQQSSVKPGTGDPVWGERYAFAAPAEALLEAEVRDAGAGDAVLGRGVLPVAELANIARLRKLVEVTLTDDAEREAGLLILGASLDGPGEASSPVSAPRRDAVEQPTTPPHVLSPDFAATHSRPHPSSELPSQQVSANPSLQYTTSAVPVPTANAALPPAEVIVQAGTEAPARRPPAPSPSAETLGGNWEDAVDRIIASRVLGRPPAAVWGEQPPRRLPGPVQYAKAVPNPSSQLAATAPPPPSPPAPQPALVPANPAAAWGSPTVARGLGRPTLSQGEPPRAAHSQPRSTSAEPRLPPVAASRGPGAYPVRRPPTEDGAPPYWEGRYGAAVTDRYLGLPEGSLYVSAAQRPVGNVVAASQPGRSIDPPEPLQTHLYHADTPAPLTYAPTASAGQPPPRPTPTAPHLANGSATESRVPRPAAVPEGRPKSPGELAPPVLLRPYPVVPASTLRGGRLLAMSDGRPYSSAVTHADPYDAAVSSRTHSAVYGGAYPTRSIAGYEGQPITRMYPVRRPNAVDVAEEGAVRQVMEEALLESRRPVAPPARSPTLVGMEDTAFPAAWGGRVPARPPYYGASTVTEADLRATGRYSSAVADRYALTHREASQPSGRRFELQEEPFSTRSQPAFPYSTPTKASLSLGGTYLRRSGVPESPPPPYLSRAYAAGERTLANEVEPPPIIVSNWAPPVSPPPAESGRSPRLAYATEPRVLVEEGAVWTGSYPVRRPVGYLPQRPTLVDPFARDGGTPPPVSRPARRAVVY